MKKLVSSEVKVLDTFNQVSAKGCVGLVTRVLVYCALFQLKVNNVPRPQEEHGRVGSLLVVTSAPVSCHLEATVLVQLQSAKIIEV